MRIPFCVLCAVGSVFAACAVCASCAVCCLLCAVCCVLFAVCYLCYRGVQETGGYSVASAKEKALRFIKVWRVCCAVIFAVLCAMF